MLSVRGVCHFYSPALQFTIQHHTFNIFLGAYVLQRDAQNARLLTHPPRRDKTRRSTGKAAASEDPEAYPLGRTVRRIRSTTSVRAAESVRRLGPR